MLNLNTYPYFDDFDPTKEYHKILFHPGKPVQARELTQIQSIIQEQIKRHGDHVFKNGTVVIPGHVFYDDKVKFIKLDSVYNNINIEDYLSQLVGTVITGDANGITALVVHVDAKTETDPVTLYVKYTTAAGSINEFVSGESFTCADIPGLLFKAASITTYTGNASICTINDGVYYVNGYFVGVAKQSVTVSKYTNTPSAVVGLDYVETIITENEDESLFDNAYGFSNFGAPGAHRLKITLSLVVKPYDYTSTDTAEIKFVDLLKVKAGKIEYLKDKTKYSEIESWLARRTYDESGDYAVTPFKFKAYDYRKNYRGQWVASVPYLTGDVVVNNGIYYVAMNRGYSAAGVGPTHATGVASDGAIYWSQTPKIDIFKNSGHFLVESTNIDDHLAAENKMVIEVSPGKAYVNGFEVEFNSPVLSIVSKARTTKQLTQTQIYAPAGSYVVVNNMKGLPNVSSNLTKVNILDVTGATVGSAWVRNVEYLTGSLTTPATVEYRMFIFGINMNAGKNFTRDAHSISSVVFTADIKPQIQPIQGSASIAGTTVTGIGTHFDFDFSVGERIRVGDTWRLVTAIVSPTEITVSVAATVAASSIYKGRSIGTKLGDYVRPMPMNAIKSLRNSVGAIDMEYVISKSYSFTTTGTTHSITLANGESFLPTEHIVVTNSNIATDTPVNATYTLDGTATTLTIGGLTASTAYKALLLVKRTSLFAKEKVKTLSVKTVEFTSVSATPYTAKEFNLTEADVVRIIKITESGDPNNKTTYVEAGESDITNYFTFDNGQRPEYYDVGRVKTTRNNTRPIRVTFEYFVHSDGDYFSADSYATVPRALLKETKVGGASYFLPDCLDFRPRISDNGTEFNISTGASITDPLLSEMTMSTSYSYYVNRTDELGINTDGTISYTMGGKHQSGMLLATVDVPAYTDEPAKSVQFTDNQVIGYKMKDIGAIDKRLTGVEYYVALSELEKKTLNTSIKDEFGLERDKNGIVVDEFVDFAVSDISNPDLMSSIDPVKKEMRSIAIINGVHLVEPDGMSDSSRQTNHYQLTGDVFSLPYTEEVAINQVMASTPEYVQAYATLDFTGQLSVYPSADNYVNDYYNTIDDPSTVLSPVTVNVDKTSRVYGGVKYVTPSYRGRRRYD